MNQVYLQWIVKVHKVTECVMTILNCFCVFTTVAGIMSVEPSNDKTGAFNNYPDSLYRKCWIRN